jgi:hypothetical protein
LGSRKRPFQISRNRTCSWKRKNGCLGQGWGRGDTFIGHTLSVFPGISLPNVTTLVKICLLWRSSNLIANFSGSRVDYTSILSVGQGGQASKFVFFLWNWGIPTFL